MLKLMLITGDPEVARYAFDAGIGTIFVDLERLGKQERQGGQDTVKSTHTLADAAAVRRAVPQAELLVRLDPPHDGAPGQARAALDAGADLLMLPMWRTPEEVAGMGRAIDDRPCLIPLTETPEGAAAFAQVATLPCVKEMYVGLNDLHLALGLRFMFEPLADGLVDHLAQACHRAGKPFGFGGMARLGEGALPAEYVLGEHLRLGSSRVILSRAFHERSLTLTDFHRANLPAAVAALRDRERELANRTPEEVTRDHDEAARLIRLIAAGKHAEPLEARVAPSGPRRKWSG